MALINAARELPPLFQIYNSTAPTEAAFIVIDQLPTFYGGFSDVYAGKYCAPIFGITDTMISKKVAVKVLRPPAYSDLERTLKHLRREVLVWSMIDHPSIVEFLGITSLGPRPALISRWYDNGVASKYLQGKTFDDKLPVIRDIANAITHLHSLNTVHGDIKGTNILISDEGRGLVTDFGLSRLVGVQTGYTTSSMPGSTRWQAPELLTPTSTPADRSKESDVWAFACTVYELLADQPPYASLRNNLTLISAITSGTTPLQFAAAVAVPGLIYDILNRCWAMIPSDRPPMDELTGLLLV